MTPEIGVPEPSRILAEVIRDTVPFQLTTEYWNPMSSQPERYRSS
jgi:hypothetical protein